MRPAVVQEVENSSHWVLAFSLARLSEKRGDRSKKDAVSFSGVVFALPTSPGTSRAELLPLLLLLLLATSIRRLYQGAVETKSDASP